MIAEATVMISPERRASMPGGTARARSIAESWLPAMALFIDLVTTGVVPGHGHAASEGRAALMILARAGLE